MAPVHRCGSPMSPSMTASITAVGTDVGPGVARDRRRRAAGHPGLRRRAHPLRRSGDVGPVPHAVVVARRHHRRDGQLRCRLRSCRARPPRVADRDDGRRRGHPRRRADRRHPVGVGDVPRVPRRARRPAVRDRHRHPGAARCRARLRDGRPRGGQRTGHGRRHGGDGRPGRRGPPRRSAGLLHQSRTPLHKSKSGELVPGTMVAAEELYGIAEAMADGRPRRVPVRPRARDPRPSRNGRGCASWRSRTGRTVSVNFSQIDSHPTCGATSSPSSTRHRADGIPIVAQVHGRTVGLLMCLEGSYHPLMFHPAYARDRRACRSPSGCAALARRAGPRARSSTSFPTTAASSSKVALGAMTQDLGGRRRRHRLRAASRRLARRRRRAARRPGDAAGDRPPAHRRGQRDAVLAVLQLRYGDLSFNYEAHMHPSTRMGLADAGAHCRVICDGGTPDVHAHALDPRPHPRPEDAARVRRPPPDPPDRRAVRTRRSRAARARHAGRHQRDRLRRAARSASRAWRGTCPAARRGSCRRRSGYRHTFVRRRRDRRPTTSSPARCPAGSSAARANQSWQPDHVGIGAARRSSSAHSSAPLTDCKAAFAGTPPPPRSVRR